MADPSTDVASIKDAIEKLAEALAKLSPELKDIIDGTKKATSTGVDYVKILKEQQRGTEQLNAKLKLIEINWTTATDAEKKYYQEQKLNQKKQEDYVKSLTEQTSALQKVGKQVLTLGKQWQQGLAFLGGSTLSIKGGKDAILQYNESMFALRRAQQVAGRGLKDLDKAFSEIKTNTTLARKDFAEFANIVTQSYKGIAPSAGAIAKFAKNIQMAFGPDPKKTVEVARQLMGIMDKFPALFENVNKVMAGAQSGITGKALEKTRASLLLTASAAGMSTSEIKLMAQAMTGVTKEQKEQIALNRATQKVNQRTEDIMLGAAQSMEKAFTKVSESLEGILAQLEQIPMLIASMSLGKGVAGGLMPDLGDLLMGGRMGKGAMGRMGQRFGAFAKFGAGGVPKVDISGMSPKAAASFTKSLASAGKWAKGGAVLAVAAGLIEGGLMYHEARKKGVDRGTAGKAAVAKGGIGMAGALGGAALGFAVGGPVGAIIGGVAGGFMGSKWGDKAAAAIMEKQKDDTEKMSEYAKDMEDNFTKILLQTSAMETNLGEMLKITGSIQQSTNSILDAYYKMGLIMPDTLNPLMQIDISSLKAGLKQTEGLVKNYFAEDGIINATMRAIGQDIDVSEIIGFSPENIDSSNMDTAINKMMGSLSQIVDKMTPDEQQQIAAIQAEAALIEKKRDELMVDLKSKGVDEEKIANDAEILKLQDDINKKNFQAAEINKEGAAALGLQAKLMQTSQKSAEQRVKVMEAERNIISKQTALAEEQGGTYARLVGAQRELYEAAMFGMGASIEMMQKQVNLEFQLAKSQEERIQKSETRMQESQKKLTGKTMSKQQMDMAASMADAQQRKNYLASQGLKIDEQINMALNERTDAMTKQAEHQKKIYDLTKEMREGYLDAVREMSVGAGEFEKIIGTQEMGVTQLMDAVNNFTTSGNVNMLNTMKLGGYQSGALTQAGVGGSYAGMYGLGGASFESGTMANLKNQRVYGYDKSMAEFQRLAKGEGAPPTVGTGVAGQVTTDTIAAMRDPSNNAMRVSIVNDDTGQGNVMHGINPGVGGFRDPGQVTGRGINYTAPYILGAKVLAGARGGKGDSWAGPATTVNPASPVTNPPITTTQAAAATAAANAAVTEPPKTGEKKAEEKKRKPDRANVNRFIKHVENISNFEEAQSVISNLPIPEESKKDVYSEWAKRQSHNSKLIGWWTGAHKGLAGVGVNLAQKEMRNVEKISAELPEEERMGFAAQALGKVKADKMPSGTRTINNVGLLIRSLTADKELTELDAEKLAPSLAQAYEGAPIPESDLEKLPSVLAKATLLSQKKQMGEKILEPSTFASAYNELRNPDFKAQDEVIKLAAMEYAKKEGLEGQDLPLEQREWFAKKFLGQEGIGLGQYAGGISAFAEALPHAIEPPKPETVPSEEQKPITTLDKPEPFKTSYNVKDLLASEGDRGNVQAFLGKVGKFRKEREDTTKSYYNADQRMKTIESLFGGKKDVTVPASVDDVNALLSGKLGKDKLGKDKIKTAMEYFGVEDASSLRNVMGETGLPSDLAKKIGTTRKETEEEFIKRIDAETVSAIDPGGEMGSTGQRKYFDEYQKMMKTKKEAQSLLGPEGRLSSKYGIMDAKGNIRSVRPEELNEDERKQAQALRDSMKDVKPGKGETMQDALMKAGLKDLQTGIDPQGRSMAEALDEQEVTQALRLRSAAANMKLTQVKPGVIGAVEGTSAQKASAGGVTSAEEERIGTVSPQAAAKLQDPNMQAAAAARGIDVGGSGAGGGTGGLVEVIVRLDSNLEADIEQIKNVVVSLQGASGQKSPA